MIYTKKAISIEEQIVLLKERGLIISNTAKAGKYLSNISYYRLAGYWWPLQSDKEKHLFKEGSRFQTVLDLYNFDAELRLMIFGVIEKIEISLRTKLIYHMSNSHGPWWFQKGELFQNVPELIKSLEKLREEVERSKDTFMKEHRRTYKKDLRFPPSWKSLELTSFGGLSKLYGNLRNNLPEKDTIAKEFGAVNHTYLPSWLQSVTQIRNICAHHGRLWNKNLPGTVKLLPKPPNPWVLDPPKPHEFQRVYVHLCIMRYLLNTIHPRNSMNDNLKNLLTKYPNVDENALGMKHNWRGENLWK
jgi:abortive infection bacteriophage resistance protein